MFESTIEAQALHAGEKRLGTLSAALLAHLAIALAIVAVTAVIVPSVITPDPKPIWVISPPIPQGDPTPPAPPSRPPQGGGPRDVPKVLVMPRPDPPIQPATTPDTLPNAAPEAPGADDGGPGVPGASGGGPTGVGEGAGPEGAGGDSTAAPPVELTGDMLRPVLLVRVEPVYPTTARLARLPGKVLVEAVIGPDGRVESAEVLSSTSSLFDAAALDAVRQWRYSPATMNGRPVRVYFKVAVTFTLR